MTPQTFCPRWLGQVLSATTSTTSTTLSFSGTNAVRIYNSVNSADEVCVRLSVGSDTATTNDLRIAPGGCETFSKGNADTISYICPTSTATVVVNVGEGM